MRPLLLSVWLTGCASLLPAPVPMRSVHQPDPLGKARCLLVFLPGNGDHAERFEQERLVDAVRRRNLSVDVVSAEATLGYYLRQTITQRLDEDVIGPARAAGYEEVWLAGVSLGGAGTLTYAQRRPGQLTGVLALSPWLGSDGLITEIERAGGLASWQAGANEGDYERALWRWLRSVTVEHTPGPELYLGWGEADRLARADGLLGATLTPAQVFKVPGGHGWASWRALFDQFLERSSFGERCRR